MGALLKDLKHSAYNVLRTPGFTLTAVAMLALGIAANTAIFSVVNSLGTFPVRFPHPDDPGDSPGTSMSVFPVTTAIRTNSTIFPLGA